MHNSTSNYNAVCCPSIRNQKELLCLEGLQKQFQVRCLVGLPVSLTVVQSHLTLDVVKLVLEFYLEHQDSEQYWVCESEHNAWLMVLKAVQFLKIATVFAINKLLLRTS